MTPRSQQISLDAFFDGADPQSRVLFGHVEPLVGQLSGATMRVTKSQVAWSRRRAFAWAWMPQQYLGEDRGLAPLVVSVDLPAADDSPRWKQVVEVRPGHFMHHLEIHSVNDIDDEVAGWFARAWELAE